MVGAHRILETEVLVVGLGGAGCRAAIEARKAGRQVLLVAKGALGRSGLTPMTMPGFAAVMGTRDLRDSPEQHFLDTMRGGYGLNNPNLVRIMTQGAPEEIRYLEGLGVRFDRTEKGEIEQLPLPGHTYRRCCWLDDNMGRILLNVLGSELARLGVNLMEDIFLIDLLHEGGKVLGAVALDMRQGHLVAFLAKAVLLATGGNEALYIFRTTSPREAGDGQAMAFRAGAELIDMEFMQFNPYTIIYPEAARGVLVPADTTLMAIGAKYRNREGEAFLAHYDPERKEMTTRDVKTKAMYLEILEGRGSEHGGVYLDCTQLADLDGLPPAEVLRRQGGQLGRYLSLFGVDIYKGMFEIAPAAHFPCGGIRIREDASTTLEGLYAAGEVAGGCHGANRLDANSMPEVFVFGRIAGQSAAAHASRVKPPSLTPAMEAQIQAAGETVFGLLHSEGGGACAGAIKESIEAAVFAGLGPIRDEASMKRGLEAIEEVAEHELPRLRLEDKGQVYNLEWMEALEIRNMCDVARMMFLSALNRRESRGAHYRRDYLEMDPGLQKNSLVRKEGDDLRVSMEDTPVDREGCWR